MTEIVAVTAVAFVLLFWPGLFAARRARRMLRPRGEQATMLRPAPPRVRPDREPPRGQPRTRGRGGVRSAVLSLSAARRRQPLAPVPMTVVVQQLAALLRGGRPPMRLWDELAQLYSGSVLPGRSWDGPNRGPVLHPDSAAILLLARAAAAQGASVAAAIRARPPATPGGFTGRVDAAAAREGLVWDRLADCLDVAESSGCPLAGVLTRFGMALDLEDDAEAARQSSLAGPRATVRLLTWLPLLGLGLGMLLGDDPLGALLQRPAGLAALTAGVCLTAVGRVWSSRLVRAAARVAP